MSGLQPPVRLSWFDRGLTGLTTIAAWDIRASGAASARTLETISLQQSESVALQRQLVYLASSIDLDLVALGRAIEIQTVALLQTLEEQSRVLEGQTEILEDVRDALRRPARTRAAERLLDAAELLRRGRYDRALSTCSAAIEDDPNNPNVYWGTAVALVGLERFPDALGMLEEAAAASDGTDKAKALRAASRVALEAGDAVRARELGRQAEMAGSWTGTERALFLVERLVCEVVAGDQGAASNLMEEILEIDWRVARLALASEFIAESPTVTALLTQQVGAALASVTALEKETVTDLEEAERSCAEAYAAARHVRTDLVPAAPLVSTARSKLDASTTIACLSERRLAVAEVREEARAARAAASELGATIPLLLAEARLMDEEFARAKLPSRFSGDALWQTIYPAWNTNDPGTCLRVLESARNNSRRSHERLGTLIEEALTWERERERREAEAAEQRERKRERDRESDRERERERDRKREREAIDREWRRLRPTLWRAGVPTIRSGIPGRRKAAGPSWQPDPVAQSAFRWWDGLRWTRHVATDSQGGEPPERSGDEGVRPMARP